jgi:hypothetical protein
LRGARLGGVDFVDIPAGRGRPVTEAYSERDRLIGRAIAEALSDGDQVKGDQLRSFLSMMMKRFEIEPVLLAEKLNDPSTQIRKRDQKAWLFWMDIC